MSNNETTITTDDPVELLDELNRRCETIRGELRTLGQLSRELQRVAAVHAVTGAGPRIVHIRRKAPVDPVTGQPLRRSRGRPKGSRNGLSVLYATETQLAQLRRQLG